MRPNRIKSLSDTAGMLKWLKTFLTSNKAPPDTLEAKAPSKAATSWQKRVAELGQLTPAATQIDLVPPEQQDLDERLHASRMNKLAQAEAAARKYGNKVMFMHMSALSATTRKSHAERHGKLFTAEEVRSFWASPENRIGCKCTAMEIVLDANGAPLSPGIQKRAMQTYKKMKARGYDWSKP